MNRLLELVGVSAVVIAAVVAAVVVGSWSWQAGALVGCAEAMFAGIVLVMLSNERTKAEALTEGRRQP